MKPVIEINNLTKEYQLGVIGRDTFYRDFQSFVAKILNKEDPNSLLYAKNHNNKSNKFLALNNINLNINRGDVVGIIGKNGAGKSTLLKILSRITYPSKGNIKIYGKMASLLEVGTGFHGELTGRENIFLNGAINGMEVEAVKRELENIIKFSGILEKHIDTPVKRYSSGMIVKLGFSIAAHLDYDILICDEVLAVGDQEFQNKAINKVKEINDDAKKTVIFVSHNMDSILKICTKVVILNEGKIVLQGEPHKIVETYLNSKSFRKNYCERIWNDSNAPSSSIVKLSSIKTKNENGDIESKFDISEKIYIEINFEVLKDGNSFCTNLVFSRNNQILFQSFDESILRDWYNPKLKKKGIYSQVCEVPSNLFETGIIDLNIVIFNPPGDIDSSYQIMEPKGDVGVLSFQIYEKNYNLSRGTFPYGWANGSHFRTVCKWNTKIED